MQLYHFVLVFFSHCGVRLKKWISAVYLTKHAWNIQPSVFNSFHMTLIHGESHKFWQGPFSTLELSKDPPKNKQGFNSSVIRHFSASEKISSFGDRITFFSQWKFRPTCSLIRPWWLSLKRIWTSTALFLNIFFFWWSPHFSYLNLPATIPQKSSYMQF